MKIKSAVAICILLTNSPLYSAEAGNDDRKSISVDALNDLKIIGKLGIPLGKAVEMEATIISGSDTGLKQHDGDYLLKLQSVGGKSLTAPVVMSFRGQHESSAPFPRNAFELHQQNFPKKAGIISDELLKQLEKNFVGIQVKFLGYESGRFGGVPNGLPKAYPVWADTGFGFQSELVVLEKL
jgi:hypothetical protein